MAILFPKLFPITKESLRTNPVPVRSSIQVNFLFLPLLLLLSPSITSAAGPIHVVSYDSTTLSGSLNWPSWSGSNPDPQTQGWVETSYTIPGKVRSQRIFHVCDVDSDSVNNWLFTPFIPRHSGNRMYIEISFTMRTCTQFDGDVKLCRETFDLYYYQKDYDILRTEKVSDHVGDFTKIDRIAAEVRFDDQAQSDLNSTLNVELRSVPITTTGMYFAVEDTGSCMSIISVRVYYVSCPELVRNWAVFPETPTDSKETSFIEVEGHCIQNAEVTIQPRAYCVSDGSWQTYQGSCACKAGYTNSNGECTPCPATTYKAELGSQACSPCPLHSFTTVSGSTECKCQSEYYRSSNDLVSMACTKPPSEPQELTYTVVDHGNVQLEWKPPSFVGGRADIEYDVSCLNCPGATFQPGSTSLVQTSVRISDLKSSERYMVTISARNGVSAIAGVPRGASSQIEISTIPDVDATVEGLKIVDVGSTFVKLSWSPYESSTYESGVVYELLYYPSANEHQTNSIATEDISMVVTALDRNTEYVFSVRPKIDPLGWGTFSSPEIITTGTILPPDPAGMESFNN